MLISKAAKLDSLIRPFIVQKYPEFSISLYSKMRKFFLNNLSNSKPEKIYFENDHSIKLWDLDFNCNFFNSAGMFKNGAGYELVYRQGAGAFLAGTTTFLPRAGNQKNGVIHPFIPLPNSKAAINWMGLPNDGHQKIANVLSKIDKKKGCPIGISISSDPEIEENEALKNLISGFNIFDKANVDFIELNESCPNVSHHNCDTTGGIDEGLIKRLEFLSENFLKKRNRNLPVIVKFSVETELNQIPTLVKILVDLGFDGVNFGNTAKIYSNYISDIDETELNSYRIFTEQFGGGLSGNPLKNLSLECCKIAIEERNKIKLKSEFGIIRTGGIETKSDLIESNKIGVDLNQWFTGYFEAFGQYGHNLYKEIIENAKS